MALGGAKTVEPQVQTTRYRSWPTWVRCSALSLRTPAAILWRLGIAVLTHVGQDDPRDAASLPIPVTRGVFSERHGWERPY